MLYLWRSLNGLTFLQSSACGLPQTRLSNLCFFCLFVFLLLLFLIVSGFFSFMFVLSIPSSPLLLLYLSNFSAQLLSSLRDRLWSPGSHTTSPHNATANTHQHGLSARNLRVQQVVQPVDPLAGPGVGRTCLDSGDIKDGQAVSDSQLSQPSELTQPSSTGNPRRGAEPLGFAGRVLSCRPYRSGCLISSLWLLLFSSCMCLRQEEPPPLHRLTQLFFGFF